MNEPLEKQLEQLIDRELKQLPERKAPVDLLPRVMAAVQAGQRLPWWQRSWAAWPPAQRVVGLGLAGVLILSTFQLATSLWSSLETAPSRLAQSFQGFSPTIDLIGTLTNAVMVLIGSLSSPLALGIVGVVLAMYLTCVGAGTVCFRLMFNRR